MNFLELYKRKEESLCSVFLNNTFVSIENLRTKLISTQQNNLLPLFCHFAGYNIILSPDIELIMNEMKDQGLFSHDEINLNSKGKEILAKHVCKEAKILLLEDEPEFPAELIKELFVNSKKIMFNVSINKNTYDLIWSFPVIFEFYVLFNFYPREPYLSLVVNYTDKTSISIDTGSLMYKTELAKKKRYLEKNYSSLSNFYFTLTEKTNLNQLVLNFINYLISSTMRYIITEYKMGEFYPIFGYSLRDIAQKDRMSEIVSFKRYSLEHFILKDWSRGKLHELYFHRILQQCNLFDFIVPCVTSIKIDNVNYPDFEEGDIIAIKGSKIFIFELKRSREKNSLNKALFQINKHLVFFEQQGFECKGFLISLSEKRYFQYKGRRIKNITPCEINQMIENGIFDIDS